MKCGTVRACHSLPVQRRKCHISAESLVPAPFLRVRCLSASAFCVLPLSPLRVPSPACLVSVPCSMSRATGGHVRSVRHVSSDIVHRHRGDPVRTASTVVSGGSDGSRRTCRTLCDSGTLWWCSLCLSVCADCRVSFSYRSGYN